MIKKNFEKWHSTERTLELGNLCSRPAFQTLKKGIVLPEHQRRVAVSAMDNNFYEFSSFW